MRVLVIDNYDSFVYTLDGYLQQLGAETTVMRNDAVPGDQAAGEPHCGERRRTADIPASRLADVGLERQVHEP